MPGTARLTWRASPRMAGNGSAARPDSARSASTVAAGMDSAEAGLVLIDGPVSPVQQRNLEKEWKVKLLDRTGLSIGDFDVIELNEAFASQSLACLRELGLPDDAEHVNPNGGAIALGHPTGMSGARITGTAALELRRRGGRRALATMCVGVGQGMALLLEAV